jgi:hypothetical protein
MNKNQIRKEIAALIDSIKDHSDNIGDKQHITQLELELILSKVKKLYEKSIVYNYLNSLPAPHTLHTLDPVTNELFSKSSGTIGQHRSDTVTTVDLATPSTLSLNPESDSTPERDPVKEDTPIFKKSYPDLKSLIGLNQKFQFIKLLFDNDTLAFNESLTKIDALQTLAEAQEFLNMLTTTHKWDTEQETYLMFQHVIEKKFS